MVKKLLFTCFCVSLLTMLNSQIIADFEGILSAGDSIQNGADGTTFIESGAAVFPITYNPDFGGYWDTDWAVSQVKDDSTQGFSNLLGAITGIGNRGSETYLVGQKNMVIALKDEAVGKPARGMYVTNTTYAYYSMIEGDAFAKKFGGEDGTDPDFFALNIHGVLNGMPTMDTVTFYLADYRFADDSLDYIVDSWTYVDLQPLGPVDSLIFMFSSSDVGDFGINTPLFFAMDDVIMAEPAASPDYVIDFEFPFLGLDIGDQGEGGIEGFDYGSVFFPNVYETEFGGYWADGWALSSRRDSVTSGPPSLLSAITGEGQNESLQYMVGRRDAIMRLNGMSRGSVLQGLSITNTTYAHNSMRDGDAFAKKFGGDTGADPDFFSVTIKKYLNGTAGTDSVVFYLADFRFEDDSLDYIVDDWEYVDLQSLGPVDSLMFIIRSSDVGDFGINTPAYFAIDDLTLADPATMTGVVASDPSILSWATNIEVMRGPEDLSDPTSLVVSSGTPENAVGPYSSSSVSLGDGGVAEVSFAGPLYDGPGPDFVIFENGFPSGGAYFLELAFVEVSSDGETFIRFPATSLTNTESQVGPFGLLRPEQLRNLAGQFPGQIGTAFDLSELVGMDGINVDSVTHIRIIDVVGSVDPALASFDRDGRIINDPFPTPFPSGGFDLSAVGAIHILETTRTVARQVKPIEVFPNPTADVIRIKSLNQTGEGLIFNTNGQCVKSFAIDSNNAIDMSNLPVGLYYLLVTTSDQTYSARIVKQ
ncbi:MAG: DUF4465 domain-containing protein [Saprospiraceae bacterium]|nr:DUF4465 domain-containing protein [Saprospiraceae bacterium]